MIEWNIVLAVIFGAAAVVGGAETVYQIYKLTALDAAARGLEHPKLWGCLQPTETIQADCCYI